MRTLLFIDDDEDVREAFCDLFMFAGWTVAGAGDGLEALAWLAAHELPEVIVLDLKMPGCDGYEFRERQLADPRLARIPTVIFTADAQVDDADVASLREVPIIRKSAGFAQLLAAVERAHVARAR